MDPGSLSPLFPFTGSADMAVFAWKSGQLKKNVPTYPHQDKETTGLVPMLRLGLQR